MASEFIPIKFTGDASDAVSAARQVKAALKDVENGAKDASQTLGRAAQVNVEASTRQVKAQRELHDHYSSVARNAKRGSDEQVAANRLAEQSGRKLGLSLDDTDKSSRRAAHGFGVMARAATIGAGVLAGGLALAARSAFRELSDSSKASAQTAAALKSTGGAANVTQKQIEGLAGAIQKKTGIDDEAVQASENLLLTFTKVRNEVGKGNDIFNQATKAVADLSTRLGGDTQTAALQLGKALQDPVRGMSGLRRVGVSFTEAQREQVKALVESGDAMGAQKVILAELTTEFGGSAEAAGKTFPGQLQIAKGELENVSGSLLQGLLPALTALLSGINDIIPKLAEWGGTLADKVGPSVSGVVEIFQKSWPAVQRLTGELVDFFKAHLLPIFQTLREAVETAMARVMGVFQKNEPEIRQIFDSIKVIIGLAADVFKTVLLPVIVFVLEEVLPRAIGVAIKTLATISAPITAFSGFFTAAKETVTGSVHGLRDAVSGSVDAIVGFFSSLPKRLAGFLGEMGSEVVAPYRAAFTEIKTWAGERLEDVVEFFRSLPRRLGNALEGLAGVFGSEGAFRTPIRNVVTFVSDKIAAIVGFWAGMPGQVAGAIADGADAIREAVVGLFGKLPGWAKKILGIESPSKVFAEIGANVVQGFIDGLERMGPQLLKKAEGLASSAVGAAGDVAGRVGGAVSSAAGAVAGAVTGDTGGGLSFHVVAALKWAAEHGWRGSVSSGYRSVAEQAYLYDHAEELGLVRGKTVAAPGSSSHQSGDAVDVTDVPGFAAAMALAPESIRLYNRVPNDAVHFSVSGFAEGGIVRGGRGGLLALIGEQQRDEAVIPLPKDWEQTSDARTSAGVTWSGDVHVHGNVMSERDLVESVRGGLFKLAKLNGGRALGGYA